MARDFKSRAQRAPSKAATPAWVWLLIGYVAGMASLGLIWVKMSGNKADVEKWIGDKPPEVRTTTKPTPPKEEPAANDKLQFDFYSLLTNTEVLVTDDDLAKASAQAQKPQPVAEKPVPQQTYLIQVASFRSAQDADAVKAKLALTGMKAVITRVENKGVTWHRVSVGPVGSSAEVQKLRKQLMDGGYKTLVIGNKT